MLISRAFKDLNISFEKHPVTKDLQNVKDFNAIKKSVQNLVLTKPGERFFNPSIGSRLSGLLFEPMDFISSDAVKSEIEYTIKAFEPRISLKEIRTEIDYDNNGYAIEIEFTVIGLPEKTQQIELFLERTRA
jgi:phage baseplate assembly protein W